MEIGSRPELPADLEEGYVRFRANHYARHLKTYEALAHGQDPHVMVISCCDSRVDPVSIFDAGPGELFVVRNVANLVPPYTPTGGYNGTSAALEFAITGLGVSDIVVLGHGQCGGIRAYLESRRAETTKPTFITRWMSLVHGADRYLPEGAQVSGAAEQEAYEHASILNSLDNLLTFPFVRNAINHGDLRLHGAHFSIADALLYVLDPATGKALPID